MYFQEQNLFQKVPSEEGPPPALLPSCCPSASPMRVQSAPCFKCVLPEVVFTKIRRRVCFPVFLTQKLASHAHALGFSETTPYCTETFYNDRSFGQPHFILLLIELLVICYSCVILPCAQLLCLTQPVPYGKTLFKIFLILPLLIYLIGAQSMFAEVLN